MPIQTTVLRSEPGIKRDGTKFDGNNYVDGQWVRFQRGLPRKIGGYKTTQKYLSEVSRGFATFSQMLFVYCHSGGDNTLERFTLDQTGNSSIVTDRTPVLASAYGTVTIAGASGAVDMIAVDGVDIMSGSVAFNTDINQTATDVASNITAFTSTPNYTANAVGAIITITSATAGDQANNFIITTTLTTLTSTIVNMNYGSDALITSVHNYWMFDFQYDSSTNQNYVLAQVSPNGDCICNDQDGQIFFGEVLGTDVLRSVSLPANTNVTGGIVSLHPYLFYYGTDGIIGWSIPGNPTDLLGTGSGNARVWGQKIIKGLPLRAGSGTAPAGIFWAFDAVIRATFVGGASVFQFDIVATDTSILSPFSPIDYDGVFYWAGVDRFYMFNGVVREVPNSLNLNYFFDGINRNAATKCFSYKVPRFGEIWWAYPKGTATECTHAVVYNIRENTWYDTELPNNGRSAGQFNNSFASPILTGVKSSPLPLDPTETFAVTVVNSGSGNKYNMSGSAQPTLTFREGNNYRFDQSDSSNVGHPLRLSSISDGTHGGGVEYTTGVTVVGVLGQAGAYTQIIVPTGAPTLYYYCTIHSGMGGQINTNVRGIGYKVWQHEFGVDEIDGPTITPIKSFFETADLSTLTQGANRYLRITQIEPDFVQVGDMTVEITGRANARAPEVTSSTVSFPASATQPYEQIVMLKEQRRELRVKFTSNALYGDYQMGQIIGHMDGGDGTDLG